ARTLRGRNQRVRQQRQRARRGQREKGQDEAGQQEAVRPATVGALAATLEQEAELRRLIGSSMIYPIALLVIAIGVVLLMLLFVVPQFESMF
ncbi:hypothetical protein GY645_25165, partial [Escherichia coli]|nr:hypothetical protein [Escherichia coli]